MSTNLHIDFIWETKFHFYIPFKWGINLIEFYCIVETEIGSFIPPLSAFIACTTMQVIESSINSTELIYT